MVKTNEKLKKEVGKLYSFADIMYGDALESIGENKKLSGLKRRGFQNILTNQLMNLSKAILRILKLKKSFLKILMKNKGNILLI